MKKLLGILAIFASSSAFGQQVVDPALNACQQLLSNANAQTIQMAAQAQVLGKQLEDAKAELAKLKEPSK